MNTKSSKHYIDIYSKMLEKSTSVKDRIMKMTRYFKSPFLKNKRLHKLINIAKKLHVFKSP